MFEYKSCDTTSSEYINYLTIYHKLQVLSTGKVRVAVTSTFNSVGVYIRANKKIDISSLDDQRLEKARIALATFQSITRAEIKESKNLI